MSSGLHLLFNFKAYLHCYNYWTWFSPVVCDFDSYMYNQDILFNKNYSGDFLFRVDKFAISDEKLPVHNIKWLDGWKYQYLLKSMITTGNNYIAPVLSFYIDICIFSFYY